MSDAELRRQNRYTWMLLAFTVALMALMLQHSRASAQPHAGKFGGASTAGLIVETGSILK